MIDPKAKWEIKERVLNSLYPLKSKQDQKVNQYLRDLLNLCNSNWDVLYVLPSHFHELLYKNVPNSQSILEYKSVNELELKALQTSKAEYKLAFEKAITLDLLRK